MNNYLSGLTVVVLSYNRLNELALNLKALLQYKKKHGFQLIVVDNGSTDGSKAWLCDLKKKEGQFLLILNTSNLGVADGRNSALPYIARDSEYVLRIDDDTRILEKEIVQLYDFINMRAEIGAVSPLIVHAETKRAQNYHGERICGIANYHGACHIVRKNLIDRLGNIDSECNFGGEELDYSVRIRNEGYDVIYNPKIVVQHNNFRRSGRSGVFRKRMRLFNSTRLAFKFWPLPMAGSYSLRILTGHLLSSVRDYSVKVPVLHLYDYVRGVRSGFQSRCHLNDATVSFYKSKTLTPDVGNIPLMAKVKRSVAGHEKGV